MTAQRRRRTVVHCINPRCKNTFECPPMHYAKFRALDVGWMGRSWITDRTRLPLSEHPPVPDRGSTNGGDS
jgi:hypothetical protein